MIIMKELYSPELNNSRNIRVYLPGTYNEGNDRRYPVLYMHDGQNIFSDSNHLFGTAWNVDTAEEQLVKNGLIPEIIIVGVDNNSDRSNEYCHVAPEMYDAGRMGLLDYDNKKNPKGKEYEHFLINIVKEYVDSNYKTLTDRDNTALMGSSLGGLVTYFIGMRHPEVFGKLGIVSPAFHWLDFSSLLKAPECSMKIWIDAGVGEGHYIENSRKVVTNLMNQGLRPKENIAYYLVPDAMHNEKCWAERIHMPILYLFGDIGEPVSCEMAGRKTFGIDGMSAKQINPIAHFNNNFSMTVLNADYETENSGVMQLDRCGKVTTISEGKTKVAMRYMNCTAEADFNVISQLSEMVHIKVKAIAEYTSENLYMYYRGQHEMKRENDGSYTFELIAPRDWGIPFSISKGENYISEADPVTGKYMNHMVYAEEDMEVKVHIKAWTSNIVSIPKFHAARLNNDRDIFVALPEGYDRDKNQRYPVLYTQDGQNVFFSGISSSGTSWMINNEAERLAEENKISKIIIVAIPFMNRSIEYSYYTWKDKKVSWENVEGFNYSIEGRGEEYADFVINEVKPYIDLHFRTLKDSCNTALMGSSDGAFITFNMGIRHPEVFGKLAVMSPAFFGMDLEFLKKTEIRNELIFMDVGEKEMCLNSDALNMALLLIETGRIDGKDLFFHYVPNGEHNEADWAIRVKNPLICFFGKTGYPLTAELSGRRVLGPEEKEVYVNPILTYNTSFQRTVLYGEYIVDDETVLTVEKSGRVNIYREGKTKLIFTAEGVTAEADYKIDEALSPTVNINFTVKVPENTPEEAMIAIDSYTPANYRLERNANGLYTGSAILKRGVIINYKVRMFSDFQLKTETFKNHIKMPYRQLSADADMEIICNVEGWSD